MGVVLVWCGFAVVVVFVVVVVLVAAVVPGIGFLVVFAVNFDNDIMVL